MLSIGEARDTEPSSHGSLGCRKAVGQWQWLVSSSSGEASARVNGLQSPLEIEIKAHSMTRHVSSAEYGVHGEKKSCLLGGKHLQGDVPCERALFAQNTGELLIATSGDGFKSEPHAPPPAR